MRTFLRVEIGFVLQEIAKVRGREFGDVIELEAGANPAGGTALEITFHVLNADAREAVKRLGFRLLLSSCLISSCAWAFTGLSLWATVRAMPVPAPPPIADLPFYVACVGIALVAGFVWDLSFASRLTGVPGGVLHGWKLGGIVTLRSGSPILVTQDGDILNTDAQGEIRPNSVVRSSFGATLPCCGPTLASSLLPATPMFTPRKSGWPSRNVTMPMIIPTPAAAKPQ